MASHYAALHDTHTTSPIAEAPDCWLSHQWRQAAKRSGTRFGLLFEPRLHGQRPRACSWPKRPGSLHHSPQQSRDLHRKQGRYGRPKPLRWLIGRSGMTDARGSLRLDLALRGASGEPAGRNLCHLVLDIARDCETSIRKPMICAESRRKLRMPCTTAHSAPSTSSLMNTGLVVGGSTLSSATRATLG